MITDMFRMSESQSGSFPIYVLSPALEQIYAIGATCGTRAAHPSGAPKFISGF